MPNRRQVAVSILLLSLGLAAGACGGDDAGDASPAATSGTNGTSTTSGAIAADATWGDAGCPTVGDINQAQSAFVVEELSRSTPYECTYLLVDSLADKFVVGLFAEPSVEEAQELLADDSAYGGTLVPVDRLPGADEAVAGTHFGTSSRMWVRTGAVVVRLDIDTSGEVPLADDLPALRAAWDAIRSRLA